MRILVVGCFLLAASPSFAQKLLNIEPLVLDPYVIVYVNDGSCSAGIYRPCPGSLSDHPRRTARPVNPAGLVRFKRSPVPAHILHQHKHSKRWRSPQRPEFGYWPVGVETTMIKNGLYSLAAVTIDGVDVEVGAS
jgi:hypothetical protein